MGLTQTIEIEARDIRADDGINWEGRTIRAIGDAETIRSGSLMGGISVHAENGPAAFLKYDDSTTLVEVER